MCLTSKARQTDFTLYPGSGLFCVCVTTHDTSLSSSPLTQLFSLAKHSHNLLDFKNTRSQGKKQKWDKVWECNVKIFQIVAEIPQTFSSHSSTIFTSHWHLNWFVNLYLHELHVQLDVCVTVVRLFFANWDSHGIGNNFNKVGYGQCGGSEELQWLWQMFWTSDAAVSDKTEWEWNCITECRWRFQFLTCIAISKQRFAGGVYLIKFIDCSNWICIQQNTIYMRFIEFIAKPKFNLIYTNHLFLKWRLTWMGLLEFGSCDISQTQQQASSDCDHWPVTLGKRYHPFIQV